MLDARRISGVLVLVSFGIFAGCAPAGDVADPTEAVELHASAGTAEVHHDTSLPLGKIPAAARVAGPVVRAVKPLPRPSRPAADVVDTALQRSPLAPQA